jgi:hypothetical protein
VPRPAKKDVAWAAAHVEALTKLVETGTTDARKLVDDVYAATGVYRSAGAIGIMLRPLQAVGVKVAPGLLGNLDRCSRAQIAARRAVDAAEIAALKRGRDDRLPALLSLAAAGRLLGSAHRAKALTSQLEVATGRVVVRCADVLAKRAQLERFGDLTKRVIRAGIAPLDEIERRVKELIAAQPGCAGYALARTLHVDPRRLNPVLDQLVATGAVVRVAGVGHVGADVYGPPGWAPPAKKPRSKRIKPTLADAARTVAAAVGSGATAAVTTDPVVAAVIAAIQTGALDEIKGAVVLATLRGVGK